MTGPAVSKRPYGHMSLADIGARLALTDDDLAVLAQAALIASEVSLTNLMLAGHSIDAANHLRAACTRLAAVLAVAEREEPTE